MSETKAVLTLGYASREIYLGLREGLAGKFTHRIAVRSCLKDIEESLLVFGSRMNQYRRETVIVRLRRLQSLRELAASHSGRILADLAKQTKKDVDEALRLWPQRMAANEETRMLMASQEEAWGDLHRFLGAVLAGNNRLKCWFDIGDHMADTINGLLDKRLPVPLSEQKMEYVYESVNRLPTWERSQIEPFFPASYKSAEHLAYQLADTYLGISKLADGFEADLAALPQWNGTMLKYKQRETALKRQSNAVLILILDEFQRQGWPETLVLSDGLEGDVTQAIYHFNLKKVIRLSQGKNLDGKLTIRWIRSD